MNQKSCDERMWAINGLVECHAVGEHVEKGDVIGFRESETILRSSNLFISLPFDAACMSEVLAVSKLWPHSSASSANADFSNNCFSYERWCSEKCSPTLLFVWPM